MSTTTERIRHDDAETSGQLTELTDDPARSIAEWTTLAISTAILVGIVGAIIWLTLREAQRPPIISAEAQVEMIRHEASGYYVPVRIRNEGDMTAENAVIEGSLVIADAEPETAALTIPFLAGGKEVGGTLVFQGDPAAGELTTAVVSYTEP